MAIVHEYDEIFDCGKCTVIRRRLLALPGDDSV
jgi:hypothetical protein